MITAQIFAGKLMYPADNIQTDERIYEATMRELTNVVRNINEMFEKVMLFGHNPGLSNFANLLGSKYMPSMPTCAVVGLELNIDSWSNVERYCGKTFYFDFPKKHTK